ncbi:NADH-quinone oxidoreductase subunit N [Ekhidna sp.]
MRLSEQLTSILNDLQGAWTESTLIIGSILILLVGLIRPNEMLIKVLFGAIVLVSLWLNVNNSNEGLVLLDSLHLSKATNHFGSLFIITALLLIIFPRDKKHAAEYYFFILAMLCGSLFMMKANSILIIYLSIELVSFASYIITNFTFKKVAFEASLKYLLIGAVSSAVMLFGLGFIYGSTGAFAISDLANIGSLDTMCSAGVAMLMIGVFFKISIAPVHLWVPATYQSAPSDATAFMSIAPKLAGLLLLQRMLTLSVFDSELWIFRVVLILGILTIAIGTLGAFRQINARRMVSFGAVAHSGFLLPFALISSPTSSEAFWIYSVAYAIMNVAVFYLLDQYERKGIHELSDYGESVSSSWMGVNCTLVLVSLVGLPPLVGFTAKFFLFTTLWEYYLSSELIYVLWYLIVAVLATIGSLFYYLQIPKHIFLVKGQTNQSINFSLLTKIIATLFSIGLLLLFFAPKLVIVMQQLLNNVHE